MGAVDAAAASRFSPVCVPGEGVKVSNPARALASGIAESTGTVYSQLCFPVIPRHGWGQRLAFLPRLSVSDSGPAQWE